MALRRWLPELRMAQAEAKLGHLSPQIHEQAERLQAEARLGHLSPQIHQHQQPERVQAQAKLGHLSPQIHQQPEQHLPVSTSFAPSSSPFEASELQATTVPTTLSFPFAFVLLLLLLVSWHISSCVQFSSTSELVVFSCPAH